MMATKTIGRSFRIVQSKDGKPSLQRVNTYKTLPARYKASKRRKWTSAK
jgi:hypothetical protein